jgi:NAD(P)-dependent dehydrogenase (short-subunit alcohol dehydrogenase family)
MKGKEVLIIGGTSCLTPEIIKELSLEKYCIGLMTFRQENKIYGDYNWFYLNLEDILSIKKLLKLIENKKYKKIIFLSGNSLPNFGIDASYDIIQNFYDSYLLRYNFFIKESCKSLADDGQIIYMSSMAANCSVQDPHYSAVKAGVQAFVRSLSDNLKPNQSAFSIAPGLIHDSIAFHEQKYQGDVKKLASKEQIAKIIANSDSSYNGKVIHLGYSPQT